MKIFQTFTKHPVLYAFLITLFFGLLNLFTHYLFLSNHLVSLNYVVSAGFYGSLLFSLYYVFTFIFFLLALRFINSRIKFIVITLLIIYLLFSLPLINMDSFRFAY